MSLQVQAASATCLGAAALILWVWSKCGDVRWWVFHIILYIGNWCCTHYFVGVFFRVVEYIICSNLPKGLLYLKQLYLHFRKVLLAASICVSFNFHGLLKMTWLIATPPGAGCWRWFIATSAKCSWSTGPNVELFLYCLKGGGSDVYVVACFFLTCIQ